MIWFDELFERGARRLAQRVSRRSALVGLSRLLVGTAFLWPVLPFDRTSGKASAAEANSGKAEQEEQKCDYWRYCAIDGFLCTCCGGTVSSCPAGTQPSAVTWIGTCHNPKDKLDYLISYNDCCGVTACGRCGCNANEGERPGYRLGKHNDVDWCMANKSAMYHCSTAVIVGVKDSKS